MTPQQIYQMIWEPGLSTAEKVTEVSGRGMGMDIVKSKIEELSGTRRHRQHAGPGHDVHDQAAADAGHPAQADGGDRRRRLRHPHGVGGRDRPACRRRRRQLGARVSRWPASAGEPSPCCGWASCSLPRRRRDAACQPAETTLVIVGEAGQEVGLAVDRVLGEEDVVIKSIAENYRNVPGIAGASILGDGRVSLILDIPGLIEIVCRKADIT